MKIMLLRGTNLGMLYEHNMSKEFLLILCAKSSISTKKKGHLIGSCGGQRASIGRPDVGHGARLAGPFVRPRLYIHPPDNGT
jgi:hypothetical protein